MMINQRPPGRRVPPLLINNKLFIIACLVLSIPGSQAMDMMMYMSFWKGDQLYWLSRHFESNTDGEYATGLIVTFIFGLVIEALIWMRNFIYLKSQISAIRATEALNR